MLEAPLGWVESSHRDHSLRCKAYVTLGYSASFPPTSLYLVSAT